MERNGKVKLNNKGASLMVTVVIIGILMIFVFSLLLVSYTLFASQNKKPAARRNSEAANSLSLALETELEQADAYEESALWKYLRCNVLQSSWPYYAPEESGHGENEAFRYFNLKYQRNDDFKDYLGGSATGDLDGFPGEVTLCIYWTLPEKEEEDEPYTSEEKLDPQKITDKTGTKLYLEIICETANQTYIVTNVYNLIETEVTENHETKTLEKIKNNRYYNPWNNSISEIKRWDWELDSRQ